MAEPQITVTVRDLATGDEETQDVADDYLLICAGSCHVTHINTHPTTGTHVITIKGRK